MRGLGAGLMGKSPGMGVRMDPDGGSSEEEELMLDGGEASSVYGGTEPLDGGSA